MRVYSILFVLLLSLAQVSFAEDAADSRSSKTTPAITFKNMEYRFDKVLEGVKIVHTFAFENTGGAPLVIKEIKSTCGCTSTNYTRDEIAPGGRGEVTLELDTDGYGGEKVTQSATVFTNDPGSKGEELKITGEVALFADISPKAIKLFGAPGEEIRSVVEITPSEDYPFHIVGEPETGKDTYRCTVEEKDGKIILTAENTSTKKGIYLDTVVLRTDYPDKPEIRISVFGNIKEKKQS